MQSQKALIPKDLLFVRCVLFWSWAVLVYSNCQSLTAEAWVTKGPNVIKFLDIKGRGRTGIKHHPHSRMHVVLREGKSKAEQAAEDRARKLKKIVSAGLNREDVPLRNPSPAWAW